MTLKAMLDSLDAADEAVRGHYVEKDGKFVLDVATVNGWALEDVKGLKSALSAERKGKRDAVQHLKAFGDYDEALDTFEPAVDATEYGRMKTQLEKLKDAKPDEKAKAEREAWEKQVLDKHAGELKTRDGMVTELNAHLQKHLVLGAAATAIGKHKGDVDLLMPHVRASARLEKNGKGDYAVKVVGPDGNPLVSQKSGETGDMTIDEYVGTVLKDRFPAAYEGTGSSGTGAMGETGAGGKSRIDPNLSPEAKLEMYHAQRGA